MTDSRVATNHERRPVRSAQAQRLKGCVVRRGGIVPNWLEPGQPLRVSECIGTANEWGLVGPECAVNVMPESRREQCARYGSDSCEHARELLRSFGAAEAEQFERRVRAALDGKTPALGSMILLNGAPGVGKTTLAVASATVSGATVFYVAAGCLFGDFSDDSAKALAAEVDAAVRASAFVPSVLIVDDIDCLCPVSLLGGELGLDVLHVLQNVGALLASPSFGGKLAVVGVTANLETVHPAARALFHVWHVGALWTLEARRAVLARLGCDDDPALEEATAGLTALEIEAAVATAELEDETSVIDALRSARSPYDAGATTGEAGDAAWTDVAGMADAKRALRRAIVFPRLYASELETHGVAAPVGVLMFGPPGVGKTLLARAAAAESGARLFVLKPSNVVSDRMGVSEKILASTLEAAGAAPPSLVFIDEFDSLFPSRDTADPAKLGSSLVSTLCVALDRLRRTKARVVVIAASNRPDALDRALLQYGRFDYVVKVGLPDLQDRRHHLEILVNKTAAHALDASDLEFLAQTTHGFSGADIVRPRRTKRRMSDWFPQAYLFANASHAAHDEASLLERRHFEDALATSSTLDELLDVEDRRIDEDAQRRPAVPSFPVTDRRGPNFGDYTALPAD